MRAAVEHLIRGAEDGSGDIAADLSMAASELLENAVKYGAGPLVQLRLAREGGRFALAVTNRTASSERSSELPRYVSWLQEQEDPLSAYCALASTISASPTGAKAPGLGLARIVYAGRCELSCDISVTGEVTLRASRAHAPAARGTRRRSDG